ncbi:MAG: archease [Thermofilum sp. ex4484_15]|nr:MAG: archease [Thermofilum sp. ex4484_15]
MGKFEFLDHPSDAYIAAYGRDLKEAFENAALAMFEVMTDTKSVKPVRKVEIRVNGYDLLSLLYNWLEALLYHYGVQNLVFSKFKVNYIKKERDAYVLKGEAWGEEFDPSRHEARVEVKAVTYSLMEVKEGRGGIILKFVLDI